MKSAKAMDDKVIKVRFLLRQIFRQDSVSKNFII